MGYTPSTKAESDAQRTELLGALYYTWYGEDYALVVSRAYDETFTENGTAYDLAPYFKTYAAGKEVPGSQLKYTLTYYDSEGKKLEEVPSKAGTYEVLAELIPTGDKRYGVDWYAARVWELSDDETIPPKDTEPGNTQPPKTEKKILVSKIKITGSSTKIAAGKKIKLTASVSPKNATKKSVTWKSSNTKVATVSSSGVVTLKKGSGGKTVTITATAKDGSKVKASYKIKSMKGVVKAVSISGKTTVKAGKTLQLKAKVTASKGANTKVAWSSSNKKYATVSSTGKVKTYKAGKGKKVKITAAATDGSGKKKTVTIKIK